MSEEKAAPTERELLLASVLSAFVGDNAKHIDKMDPKDELAVQARESERYFTSGMDLLRGWPNDVVRDLATYAWDVFHHRHVHLVAGTQVATLHIGMMNVSGSMQAAIFCPPNWPEMVKKEPLMQLGALIYMASQAVDFYNKRVPPAETSKNIFDRAMSYESEFLRMFDPSALNEYQREVLKKSPDGFDRKYAYERKKVVALD